MEKVNLETIEYLSHDEDVTEDTLKRPMEDLSVNQVNQNNLLNQIVDLLETDDSSLDTLQEILTEIKRIRSKIDKEHDTDGNHKFADLENGKTYTLQVREGNIELTEV